VVHTSRDAKIKQTAPHPTISGPAHLHHVHGGTRLVVDGRALLDDRAVDDCVHALDDRQGVGGIWIEPAAESITASPTLQR
jgi:hypothetical protein